MPFPDEILRGIPNDDFIGADDFPTSDLFYFNIPPRDDGLRELSINWLDDDGALDVTFLQKKDDHIQFKGGAAVLSRNEVDRVRSNPIVKQQLQYERQAVSGNKYHGNLLLRGDVNKKVMHKIAASIAMCVTNIIPNHFYQRT